MKDELLSSAFQVTDPKAARVFVSSQRRRMLMLFADRPRSIGDAAASANLDLKRLHHHVQSLVRLGLLEIAEVIPRAGRPVKLYKARSRIFFVPDEIMPRTFDEGLIEELHGTLASDRLREARGLLLTVGDSGEPLARHIVTAGARSDSFEMWRVLGLSPADAARLKSRIEALLQEFRSTGARDERIFLFHAAAVRRTDQSGPVDNASF